ncbi:MAG: serine protease [Actinomycetota bacterium]
MKLNLPALRTASAFLVTTLALTLVASPAAAQLDWAQAAEASIQPGAVMITQGSQCTANFVFHDSNDIYLGQAAHCSGADGGGGQPNGCLNPTLPPGTPVTIEGASRPGTLAYSSWHLMQQVGEDDPETCFFNDFALVKIDPADHERVNPSMPHWGGPTGQTGSLNPGNKVLGYGSSELALGIRELKPKEGVYKSRSPQGWGHTVFTLTPGIPGDSGSALIDGQGRAFGVLSTLIILPEPLSNGVVDLTKALDYMREKTGLTDVVLAEGTEPFTGQHSPLETPFSLLAPLLNTVDSIVAQLRMLGL